MQEGRGQSNRAAPPAPEEPVKQAELRHLMLVRHQLLNNLSDATRPPTPAIYDWVSRKAAAYIGRWFTIWISTSRTMSLPSTLVAASPSFDFTCGTSSTPPLITLPEAMAP